MNPAPQGGGMRELHPPVPGYKKKLGLSVDGYFACMVPSDLIGRMDWSLQVDGEGLSRTDGNGFYPGTGHEVAAAK